MEQEIRGSLQRLLEAIQQSRGPVIAEEMARLDQLLQRGRAGLNPRLVHFLEQRSYVKAWQFLSGDTDIPVGICGGGRG